MNAPAYLICPCGRTFIIVVAMRDARIVCVASMASIHRQTAECFVEPFNQMVCEIVRNVGNATQRSRETRRRRRRRQRWNFAANAKAQLSNKLVRSDTFSHYDCCATVQKSVDHAAAAAATPAKHWQPEQIYNSTYLCGPHRLCP